jgi:hypothetical protein
MNQPSAISHQPSSWCPTPQSIAAFHQQVDRVLTPAITEQFRPLSRFSTLLKPDYPPQKEGGVK